MSDVSPRPTAVAKVQRKELRDTLMAYAPKIAVFGVSPDAYIEAALMACVKTPALFKCTPESVALSLRQCAQTGLEIGRTAHLVPYGNACTFVPDYKGLIELATGTNKVVSIRTRSVYEGEDFQYYEDIGGPVLKHVPRMSGNGGKIVAAYAIADLRFNHFKVEFMTAEEIDAIRQSKSKSWKDGLLTDWYARKTVVRRLCKTLPSSAKLQQALKFDDTEDGDIPDAEVMPNAQPALPRGSSMTVDYSEAATPPARYDGKQGPTPTVVTDEELRQSAAAARQRSQRDDGLGGYDGMPPISEHDDELEDIDE